ncbi:NAD-dependent epimerase/dehydratase family protein [Actinophytocola sp.]|uniref:NAD-dependent epimerase/dehydratase family protein n=1 Tax=Actinophytocola sp. TaxID=1872138 RepID=UPI00389AF89F
MKVVIAGASGNVGTALLRALAGTGWELVGLARRPPGTGTAPYSAARWVTCDLSSAGAPTVLREVCAGAAAVVHLAWAVYPLTTEPPMARTNAGGTERLLAAVAAAAVPHLVCASSVAAYRPAGERPVTEDWPLDGVPGSAYSAGKATLESDLDTFERRHPHVRLTRIRPCGIVQRDAATELASWLLSPLLPRRVLGRRWLPVPLWPGLRLQVVHADDVAQAIRLILTERATGAFNLAADPVLRAPAVARIVGGALLPTPLTALSGAAWLGWRLGVQPLHPGWLRLADQASIVDSGRARRELGWSPAYGAAEAVAEFVTAARERHRGASPPLCPPEPLRFGRPTRQSQRT